MKKLLVIFILAFFSICLFADEKEADFESQLQKRKETLEFGLESEISDLISTLIKEEDNSLTEEIFALFNSTKNVTIREKAITYFTTIKDSRLKDYALTILEDPYDEKNSTVNLLFKYVTDCEIKEAAPLVKDLLDAENEDYYDSAITALGALGGADEAVFLADFLDRDLTTPRKQNLMKALGKIQAVETWDKLVETIENEDENTYVRMYAAEAIGAMKKEESIEVLLQLFEDSDPNIRTYALKGLSYFETPEVKAITIEAFKDNHYKVRLEAAAIAKKQKIAEAVPSLIYRAKNDAEASVKYDCFEALSVIDTKEGNDFLISLIEDTKKSDTQRSKAATSVLKNNNSSCIPSVIKACMEVAEDAKKTSIRYAFGKEIAKYENKSFLELCTKFLESTDTSTQGIGLDMWYKNQFSSLNDKVQSIATAKKTNANKNKAILLLEKSGIKVEKTETEESTAKK